MKCAQCGSDIPEGYDTCPVCRTKVNRFCIRCGKELTSQDNFCQNCGASRNAGSAGAGSELPPLTPEELGELRGMLQEFYDLDELMKGRKKEIITCLILYCIPLAQIVAPFYHFYIMANSGNLVNRVSQAFREAGRKGFAEKVRNVNKIIAWLWGVVILWVLLLVFGFGSLMAFIVSVGGNPGEDAELTLSLGNLAFRFALSLCSVAFGLLNLLIVIRFFKCCSLIIEQIAKLRHILKQRGYPV